jgi:hypothetical protein
MAMPVRNAPGSSRLRRLDAVLDAMDETGVSVVLIDEWLGLDEGVYHTRNFRVANGSATHLYAHAVDATAQDAWRFAQTPRVDRGNPDLDQVIGFVKPNPFQLCGRVAIIWSQRDDIALAETAYDRLVTTAQGHGVQVIICWSDVPLPLRYCCRSCRVGAICRSSSITAASCLCRMPISQPGSALRRNSLSRTPDANSNRNGGCRR